MQNTSPPLKISLFGLLTALALAPSGALFAQTILPQVDFTFALGTGGAIYRDFTAGDTPPQGRGVVGFTVDITAVDNVPTDLPAIAAFCIELAEDIGVGSYTSFDSEYLYKASAGRAGEVGTTSSNIPTGGIGQLRAAQVRYLFDQYYTSSDLGLWTQTDANPTTHAFQLSLWEITHDSDLSLSSGGSLYIGAQTDGNPATINTRNNAIALAQSWLTAIDAAGITESYQSTTYDVYTLTSTTGNGLNGYQDIVLASEKLTPIVPLQPIPEPSSALLVVIGSLFALRRRR